MENTFEKLLENTFKIALGEQIAPIEARKYINLRGTLGPDWDLETSNEFIESLYGAGALEIEVDSSYGIDSATGKIVLKEEDVPLCNCPCANLVRIKLPEANQDKVKQVLVDMFEDQASDVEEVTGEECECSLDEGFVGNAEWYVLDSELHLHWDV